jgi:hypothetical protein
MAATASAVDNWNYVASVPIWAYIQYTSEKSLPMTHTFFRLSFTSKSGDENLSAEEYPILCKGIECQNKRRITHEKRRTPLQIYHISYKRIITECESDLAEKREE